MIKSKEASATPRKCKNCGVREDATLPIALCPGVPIKWNPSHEFVEAGSGEAATPSKDAYTDAARLAAVWLENGWDFAGLPPAIMALRQDEAATGPTPDWIQMAAQEIYEKFTEWKAFNPATDSRISNVIKSHFGARASSGATQKSAGSEVTSNGLSTPACDQKWSPSSESAGRNQEGQSDHKSAQPSSSGATGPRQPDCNIGTAHECCVARMKRLEKERHRLEWAEPSDVNRPDHNAIKRELERRATKGCGPDCLYHTVIRELVNGLNHEIHRNHEHSPAGCSACMEAAEALAEAREAGERHKEQG